MVNDLRRDERLAEERMNTTPQTRHSAGSPRLYAASSRSDRSVGKAVTVSPPAGLMMALALSLGLWGAIWLAISRCVSLWN
jgi:hypothetical protein